MQCPTCSSSCDCSDNPKNIKLGPVCLKPRLQPVCTEQLSCSLFMHCWQNLANGIEQSKRQSTLTAKAPSEFRCPGEHSNPTGPRAQQNTCVRLTKPVHTSRPLLKGMACKFLLQRHGTTILRWSSFESSRELWGHDGTCMHDIENIVDLSLNEPSSDDLCCGPCIAR